MPRKEQIPEGKRQLNIILPEDLYVQVINIAPGYFGKGKGGISRLVEDALKQYISLLSMHTQKHKIEVNPNLSIREEYNTFIHELKKYWLEINGTTEIPPVISKRLAQAVIVRAFKRAKDERTQFKKLHNWFLNGLVKPMPHYLKPGKPSDWRKIKSIELVSRGEA